MKENSHSVTDTRKVEQNQTKLDVKQAFLEQDQKRLRLVALHQTACKFLSC